ncbi:hypothetical protein BKA81DRAFT_350579 [Phyllosticta paracitricarpa]
MQGIQCGVACIVQRPFRVRPHHTCDGTSIFLFHLGSYMLVEPRVAPCCRQRLVSFRRRRRRRWWCVLGLSFPLGQQQMSVATRRKVHSSRIAAACSPSLSLRLQRHQRRFPSSRLFHRQPPPSIRFRSSMVATHTGYSSVSNQTPRGEAISS